MGDEAGEETGCGEGQQVGLIIREGRCSLLAYLRGRTLGNGVLLWTLVALTVLAPVRFGSTA